MKCKVEVELMPFEVPRDVYRDKMTLQATTTPQYVPITAISAEDLEALCEQFTRDVFKAAGKSKPKRAEAAHVVERPIHVPELYKISGVHSREGESCMEHTLCFSSHGVRDGKEIYDLLKKAGF